MRQHYTVVVGHWQDDGAQRKIDRWIRVAAAVYDSRRMKVARFGDNMREVAVTEGDKVAAQIKFGYSVNGYAMGDLVAAIEAVGDASVSQLGRRIRSELRIIRRSQSGRRKTPAADRRRANRAGNQELPGRGRLWRIHHHLRKPLRPSAIAGSRGAAADAARLRLRRRGRLENGGIAAHRQGHRPRAAWRHLVHGGLHL